MLLVQVWVLGKAKYGYEKGEPTRADSPFLSHFSVQMPTSPAYSSLLLFSYKGRSREAPSIGRDG